MHLIRAIFLIAFAVFHLPALAQTGFNLDIKKPEPYENRKLKAEKSGAKKLSATRRFFQSTYTHYNYFFNANNKLNEVIDRAKLAHKDDYSKLLPYYNYTLEDTKQEKQQLDSVIYKAKTGIVMHDLRNDWIDDLYLLWGASYFLQQEFDSAYQMFQFINYAFAPKEKDGYYKFIGSRMDGSNARSIVSPEEETFLKRLTTDPPSRNNAFIWQARTLTESNQYTAASSLIGALRNDPSFPERLNTHLEEVQGYWFYRQGMWDSAANHLSLALDNAQNKQERARWEYLIGQLYELAGKPESAKPFFSASISHTIDPVLDIWARLNLIRLDKAGGDDYISQNIAELAKMVRREKYLDYRNVIYSMMARMELERNNPAAAREYMLKATKVGADNLTNRSASFLSLADLTYEQKQYTSAASYYDSIDLAQLNQSDQDRVGQRKEHLSKLVPQLATVVRQDSLQRLASLPEDERMDVLKKLARQLRKQRGLKEEENAPATASVRNADALSDPFRTQSKGEWYFYNPGSRTSGAATFKQIWGTRSNADNWRRSSSAMAELRNEVANNTRSNPAAQADIVGAGAITAETLLQSLPITPAQIAVSNDSIRNALFNSGVIYLEEMEDYPSAIAAFEELRRRFPEDANMSDVLFRLHYAYRKNGNPTAANTEKNTLLKKYPDSRLAQILQTGTDVEANRPNPASTKAYEAVYDMFLEGRFAEAKQAKKVADSTFRTNYWNPQLLYIEAVYHIKQVEDSTAIAILNKLIQQGPDAPIAEKAANLINVLGRRKEIEEELRNLQIEQPTVDSAAVVEAPKKKIEQPAQITEEKVAEKVIEVPKPVEPPVVKTPEPKPLPKTEDKPVEKVADKAPAKPVEQPPVVAKVPEKPKEPVINQNKPQEQKPVENKPAEKRIENPPAVVAMPQSKLPTRDTTQVKQVERKDATAKKDVSKMVSEPAAKTPVALPKPNEKGYNYQPDVPHYAVVILNKVDNIYGNEARNAFNRFNRDKYYNQTPNVQLLPLDGENKLLLIGSFPDVLGAVNYMQQTKPVTGSQVIPWLKAEKYSFTIISEANLEKLKAAQDLKAYEKFLESTPVRF